MMVLTMTPDRSKRHPSAPATNTVVLQDASNAADLWNNSPGMTTVYSIFSLNLVNWVVSLNFWVRASARIPLEDSWTLVVFSYRANDICRFFLPWPVRETITNYSIANDLISRLYKKLNYLTIQTNLGKSLVDSLPRPYKL